MIELLAPAGNFDALKAAVNAGADAIYLAGENFGARAYAQNFSRENLIDAVKFAHLRGVKIHVTANTILSDDELENFADFIKFLKKIHVDAILVQDLGAAKIIQEIAPEIPLHASTQMTIHNLDGVKFLEKIGFSRVVLSRELSLKEIENISKNSSIETEIFIHGAICVCYSGQCLMSSLIGGRSGNRGKCAQPCRLPYKLVDENGENFLKNVGDFILSPKDFNTLDILPQILQTGVTSLKIEGRMKRPEYVATVVKIYRDAIDGKISPNSQKNLAQIFNRDFTTAYLEKNPGKNFISDKRPNNRGVLIGRVTQISENNITIKTSEKIFIGDQIEIWVKVGGRVNFTVENFHFDGDFCTIQTKNLRGVKIHDRAFKIFDANLDAEAKKYFNGEIQRKIFVDAHISAKLNQPLTLTFTDIDGNSATSSTNFIAEIAKNRPLSFEILQKQISRLGNSAFELRNLTADIDQNIMIPISEINEVRRIVTEKLEKIRLDKFILPNEKRIKSVQKLFSPNKICIKNTEILAQVDSPEKIKIALESGADSILFSGENFQGKIFSPAELANFADRVHSQKKFFYFSSPRIFRDSDTNFFKNFQLNIFDAVYIHNLSFLNFFQNSAHIRTDFSIPVFNSQTINFLKNFGVEGVTLSPELNLNQIKNLAKISSLPVECIVHGNLELMISSYCPIGSFLGNIHEKICEKFCRKNNFYLKDRKNILFPVVTDQFCRMHILNSKTLSMIEHRNDFENISRIRIDCRFMNLDEISKIIRAYKFGGDEIKNFTRGHYFRGVTD